LGKGWKQDTAHGIIIQSGTWIFMRADRLLSLLMLLQTRGRMTADDLAAELEVSARTIYRDLTALSSSGIPVYAVRGPGGGVVLIEEYRTTLTGLSADEARALFMMNIPAPLRQLGVEQELKAALLKLSASLPDSFRIDEARARQRIYLDSSWWFQTREPQPCLAVIQQALWQDRRLRLKVRWDFFNTEFEQEAEPYGLVAKANVWYLVYGRSSAVHVVRLSEVVEAVKLPETFIHPVDFDLPAFWEKWCADYESQTPFVARVRVAPAALPTLTYYLDERARHLPSEISHRDSDGWAILSLPFESFITARTYLLGLGRAVEVLDPEPLRKSIVDFATQIQILYQEKIS
jgi:predicted DNA-binding transcriptional regulator YafY